MMLAVCQVTAQRVHLYYLFIVGCLNTEAVPKSLSLQSRFAL